MLYTYVAIDSSARLARDRKERMAQVESLVADIGNTMTKLSSFAGVRHADGIRAQPVPSFLG